MLDAVFPCSQNLFSHNRWHFLTTRQFPFKQPGVISVVRFIDGKALQHLSSSESAQSIKMTDKDKITEMQNKNAIPSPTHVKLTLTKHCFKLVWISRFCVWISCVLMHWCTKMHKRIQKVYKNALMPHGALFWGWFNNTDLKWFSYNHTNYIR